MLMEDMQHPVEVNKHTHTVMSRQNRFKLYHSQPNHVWIISISMENMHPVEVNKQTHTVMTRQNGFKISY